MPADISARVIANTQLSDDYNVLALAAPEIAVAAAPGQFVMVKAATKRAAPSAFRSSTSALASPPD
jgi:NAD(P)H-flavin reductase